MDSRQRPSDHFPRTSQSQDHGSMLPPHQPSYQNSSPRLPLPYPSRNVQPSHRQENLPPSAHDWSDYRRHDEKISEPSFPFPLSFQGCQAPSSQTHSDCSFYDNNRVRHEQRYEDLLPERRHLNSTQSVFRSLPPHNHDASVPGVHKSDLMTPLSLDDTGSSVPPYLTPAIRIASSRPTQTRASTACEFCRQYKAKCDEQKPCRNCRTKFLTCVHRTLPKKKSAHSDLLGSLTFLVQEVTTMGQRVGNMEKSLNDQRARNKSENARCAANIVAKMVLDDFERDPGQPLNPGKPSLLAYNTAQASLLLRWPSIHNLCVDILMEEKIEHIHEFTISQEQRRAILHFRDIEDGSDDLLVKVKHFHSAAEGSQPAVEAGLLRGFGNLDFDSDTIKICVQSFKDNVLKLHPILFTAELDAMVEVFLNSLDEPERGLKRKRSSTGAKQDDSFRKNGAYLERSITNALVLSVLALGELCLHRARLSDLMPVSSSYTQVAPGLDYFTFAAQIFSSHLAGASMQHVYVALFLGLYHGHIGRVLDSYSYIHTAGMTLQSIMRPSLSRLKRFRQVNSAPQSDRDNRITLAFWTCFELESDILSELPMPSSGILNHDEAMPFPDISRHVNMGYEATILASYQAQIWVRKQLNEVYSQLYDSATPDSETVVRSTPELLKMIDNPQWIPSEFRFLDSDPPTQDLLAARIRDRFWGFKVILYRQYIDAILHDKNWSPHGKDPHVLDYARLGIQALVKSTQVFHGLERGKRILIPNAFSKAHAQWGNLLVLAACCQHNALQSSVDMLELRDLFTRTMKFFEFIALPGSALEKDLHILQAVWKKLEFLQTDAK